MAMNEWKNIHCMLYKADTPHLWSTMQISAVILKLMVKFTSIFGSYRLLRMLMTWHFLTFRSLPNKLEFVYPLWSWENAHLLVNPIPKLTIILIWKTSACLKFDKTSNCAVENCHKENSESEQQTMHVLTRIWSHQILANMCLFGNDRSSHSRIQTSLEPMSTYYEWVSD